MEREVINLKKLLTGLGEKNIQAFLDGDFLSPEMEQIAIDYPLDYMELLEQLRNEYNLEYNKGDEEVALLIKTISDIRKHLVAENT